VDQFNNDFALHWDELVGWEERSVAETDFLLGLLKKFNCNNVLDVALGTGFHSIELLKRGVKVTSVDVSPAMIEVAKQNARHHSVELDVLCADWSEFKHKISKKFDCILCLGNSLACEMDTIKRQEAVLNWGHLLSKNGVIMVDRRNYEALLNHNYNFSSKGQYFGQTVKITSKITATETEFFYTFADGKTFKLQMYPLLEQDIAKLFAPANLTLLEVYGDRVLSNIGNEIGFYLSIFGRTENAHY
jgi:SAM-dependent methyltransferase